MDVRSPSCSCSCSCSDSDFPNTGGGASATVWGSTTAKSPTARCHCRRPDFYYETKKVNSCHADGCWTSGYPSSTCATASDSVTCVRDGFCESSAFESSPPSAAAFGRAAVAAHDEERHLISGAVFRRILAAVFCIGIGAVKGNIISTLL